MTNTTQPMTSKEEPKMLGNVSTDELVEMGKTHPRSALTIAYSEGLVTGINRAKANQQAVISEKDKQIAELVEALEVIADGRVRVTHKIDKCSHGQYGYEQCETCISDYAQQVIAKAKGN